jgi:hypothetical protein
MHCLITRRRHLGVALSRKELNDAKPFKGDVKISELPNEALGRTTVEAHIMSCVSHAPDLLPRLIDARVTGMGTLGWTISGLEQVGDTFYFQSWWCRLE